MKEGEAPSGLLHLSGSLDLSPGPKTKNPKAEKSREQYELEGKELGP